MIDSSTTSSTVTNSEQGREGSVLPWQHLDCYYSTMAENNSTNTTSSSRTRLLLRPPEEEGDRRSDDVESGKPKGPWKGEFVKSIVYAGLDSIVTCFSLISSISASHLSSVDALVLGFANLVADGISMGFGDFVSSSTERDVAAKERAVTKWDVTNHRKSQLEELRHKYQMLGMSAKDASTVVSVFAKYKDILVEEKMTAQKGHSHDEAAQPWKNGLVTFSAFILFGSTPLLSFIILIPFPDNEVIKFVGACLLSGLSLALLGFAKAKIAGERYLASAMVMVLNGAAAASAAYGLGWALRTVASSKE